MKERLKIWFKDVDNVRVLLLNGLLLTFLYYGTPLTLGRAFKPLIILTVIVLDISHLLGRRIVHLYMLLTYNGILTLGGMFEETGWGLLFFFLLFAMNACFFVSITLRVLRTEVD